MRIGSFVTFSADYHVPHISTSTIKLIAISALSLMAAELCDRSNQGLALLLRLVPIGCSLIWLFNRRFSNTTYVYPAPPSVHAPPPLVYAQPTVVFQTKPWWDRGWSWGRSVFHRAPATRHDHHFHKNAFPPGHHHGRGHNPHFHQAPKSRGHW